MKSVTQAAKEIRRVLKAEWPDIKFSVRAKRFAGGSSVEINWTDGPTEKEVAIKTVHLKGYSNGYYNEYISPRRLISHAAMMAAARACAEHYGIAVPEIKGGDGNPYFTDLTQVDNGLPICDKIHWAVWSTSVYGVELDEAFAEAFPILGN